MATVYLAARLCPSKEDALLAVRTMSEQEPGQWYLLQVEGEADPGTLIAEAVSKEIKGDS